jgi:hypothetical protein
MPIGAALVFVDAGVRCCSSAFRTAALVAQSDPEAIVRRNPSTSRLPHGRRGETAVGDRSSDVTGVVFVAVHAVVVGVAHAIASAIAMMRSPHLNTDSSQLFVVFR